MRANADSLGQEIEQELDSRACCHRALLWIAIGLALLIASSRIPVWGRWKSPITSGQRPDHRLTVIAVGTSLPELASSIIAARKGEHDIAIGKYSGLQPVQHPGRGGYRRHHFTDDRRARCADADILVMAALTLSLFIIGIGHSADRGSTASKAPGCWPVTRGTRPT